jgi:ABC-type sulfate transport system permease subunit
MLAVSRLVLVVSNLMFAVSRLVLVVSNLMFAVSRLVGRLKCCLLYASLSWFDRL